MSFPHLRVRHIAIALLVGSLLGFLSWPAQAGPQGKAKGKDRNQAERSRDQSDRSRTNSSIDKSSRELPEGAPRPSADQQANLQELRNSLGVMSEGAAAAEDEIRTLANDLQGMSLQAPDLALTQALATDLAAAMADASLSPQEMAELTQAVYAVMNSAGLSQEELDVLISDVEDIFLASGVDRSDVQAVASDLQAIYDASQGQTSRGKGQSERRRRAGLRSNA